MPGPVFDEDASLAENNAIRIVFNKVSTNCVDFVVCLRAKEAVIGCIFAATGRNGFEFENSALWRYAYTHTHTHEQDAHTQLTHH